MERGPIFLAGDLWFCLSLDSEFQALRGKGHLAFTVDRANFVKLKTSSKALVRFNGQKIQARVILTIF